MLNDFIQNIKDKKHIKMEDRYFKDYYSYIKAESARRTYCKVKKYIALKVQVQVQGNGLNEEAFELISTHKLAKHLKVSQTVIARAYKELEEREGWLFKFEGTSPRNSGYEIIVEREVAMRWLELHEHSTHKIKREKVYRTG